VGSSVFLLGVDGGGTTCRTRLTDRAGTVLGEGSAGPANVRFGLSAAFTQILQATDQCLEQAGVSGAQPPIVACLALAGIGDLAAANEIKAHRNPFAAMVCTSDAHAACVGAHGGRDGGIVIVGTGSIGWANIAGQSHRVGGWGFPASDEGSGAWLGNETIRRVLWASDGLTSWTDLLREVFERFGSDPHAIVRWISIARPRDYGSLAPSVVEHAARGDRVATHLMQAAAMHIDMLTNRLIELGATRLSLMGGLATHITPLLSGPTKDVLVAPLGDALSGALRLAELEAERLSVAVPG
jgi:glucosamine kinase